MVLANTGIINDDKINANATTTNIAFFTVLTPLTYVINLSLVYHINRQVALHPQVFLY